MPYSGNLAPTNTDNCTEILSMDQEISAANSSIPYATVSELTVIKEDPRETDLYVQILKALPGSIANGVTTPFNSLPLNKPLNLHIKRALDIFIAVIIIVALLSWFIPLMAILIKLDSRGPVFFLQKRNKRKGEIFTCIKYINFFSVD